MPYGRRGAGGGEGFSLGPKQNEFVDVAARDAYATANPIWLALYNTDRSFWIEVGGVTGDIQRRNAAGDDWENVTAIIRGGRGSAGNAGAPGGGAFEFYAEVDFDVTSSNDNQFLDGGFVWPVGTRWLIYQTNGRSYLLDGDVVYGDNAVDPSTAGTASMSDTRAQVSESVSGNLYVGRTADNDALFEFSSSVGDVHIEIYRYIPSVAQGGLSDAQLAELNRLSGVETDATQDQTGPEVKGLYEAEADTNAYTDNEKTKLDNVFPFANNIIPYKIGNIYRAFALGDTVVKPGNTEGTVTESGITDAPMGWQLTRPEATAALPYVYDCHIYGYTTNGVFSWQFGTPNRTDRYIVPGAGGGSPDTAAQILAKLVTVDGPGSGLDADLLDGMTPAEIAALGGAGFDLHDDVTDEIPNLAASDRFLVSDENVAGDPNNYVTMARLQDALVSAAFLTVTRQLTTEGRANELIQLALTAATTGNTEQNITVTHNSDGTLDFSVIYPNQVTQAEAEAGTSAIARLWTPLRVAQAISALAPGGTTTGLNQTQVDARVQAALMDAVMNNTETGIVVTYNTDRTLDFVVSATPAQTHLNYVGVRATDANVVDTDLTVNGMMAALMLPIYTGTAHLIYAYPTLQGPPSAIYLYQDGHRNLQNQSSIFGVTGTVTLGGEEHTWRATDDAQTGFGGYILEQAR